jgi:His-Xaa-Ser system protein HxsD
MLQAGNDPGSIKLTVEFDSGIQTLGALEAAVYRMIGVATIQIEKTQERFLCHIEGTRKNLRDTDVSPEALRERFLNFVADENLRVRVNERTDGVRNVILALAFGALARSHDEKSG